MARIYQGQPIILLVNTPHFVIETPPDFKQLATTALIRRSGSSNSGS